MNTLNFSIGILSWGSHKTLHNTLSSYKENGLLSLTDDVIIFFQEMSNTDLDIAAEFNITKVIGSQNNIGIGKAFTELVQSAKYENVLVLENDWKLIEDSVTTEEIIRGCCSELDFGRLDFIKLRNVRNPGWPLYTEVYKGREMDSPYHLLDAIHWNCNLDNQFPDQISFISNEHTEFLTANSYYGNHTNNSFMTTKNFFMNNIAPYSGNGVDLEGAIVDNWRSSNFRIGHNMIGLFKHERLDR